MPNEELIAEAKERLERYAIAKSIIKENDDWFKANWEQTGNIEHAGLVLCGRQGFKEVLKGGLFINCLLEVIEDEGMPVGIILNELDPSQMKTLSKHPDWGNRIMAKVEYHDAAEKGMTTKAGNFNCTPVNKWPSTNTNRILNPGDPLMVDEPETVSGPDPEEVNNQGDDQHVCN